MTTRLAKKKLSNHQRGRFNGKQNRPLMAMVEITNRCNMSCPVCFGNAQRSSKDFSLEEIKLRIENLLHIAGPIPLQISGGEPTLHKNLHKVVNYAKGRGFRNIELVTNGIKISQNPEYLYSLVDSGLTAVYLQFDGLQKQTYMKIRGQDMTEVRKNCISNIRKADICCTLAVAVTRGVNDHELGDIVDFGIRNIDTVRAINFQSATPFAGRFIANYDRSYSLEELIQRIEKQSSLAPGGFLSHLLGHPKCNAMSLVYVINGQLEPLFRKISEKTLSSFLESKGREVIADLFMGKERFARKHILNPKAWKVLLEASAIFGKSRNLQTILKADHILLFAKSFMDKDSLDEKRLQECNYAIAETDGVYSFCAYNNLYRFK